MSDPFFFGYGSLVNRDTHGYCEAYRARLSGWRRVWRHTDLRELAFLTAEPAPDVAIDGLIARVPGDDWAALDEREAGYGRHHLAAGLRHDAPRPVAAQIYAVPAPEAPMTPRPILLSYLDVVVQGFLREFGEDGAADFFATTAGWEAPVLDDRAAPRYPRHKVLDRGERAFVETRLAGLGARILPPDQL